MATKKPNIVIDHTPVKYIKISWNGVDNITYLLKAHVVKICGNFSAAPAYPANYPWPNVTQIEIFMSSSESHNVERFDLADVSAGLVNAGDNDQAGLDAAVLEIANSL